MKNKKIIGLILIFVFCVFCLVDVSAYELKGFETGDRVCVTVYNNNFGDGRNIYTWKQDENNNILNIPYVWPGVGMEYVETIAGADIHCYTIDSNAVGDNMVIFNNGTNQTLDLNSLGGGLIYAIHSDGLIDNKYTGTWRVYDKSELNHQLNIANNLKPIDYTISSYQALLNVLNGERGARYLATKNFTEDYDAFVLRPDSNGNFTSYYENIVEQLKLSLNSLDFRNITVDTAIGGMVTYEYEENSNTKMIITSNSTEGYELSSLKISNGTEILKDFGKEIEKNQPFTYEYNDEDIIITPVYKIKTFVINFMVGTDGKIYDKSNNEITTPVIVEYDNNYTLKVVANEGYDVKQVTVDGINYKLTDGEVEIKNIKKDVNVEVSFKLKTYTITVDGKDYTIVHGTTYDELLGQLPIEKIGYEFKNFQDKEGNLLSSSYVVNKDDELTTKYEKKSYKISFVIGKDGKIYDISNNQIILPVIIKYEDDYTLKIVANEGYDVKQVTVDGVTYKLIDGKIEIKNIQKDVEVKVDFKLKTYIITVDGKDYSFAYGTTYDELLKQINPIKKGYTFKGFKNSNGNILDDKYVVGSSDKLEIIYAKDETINVPSTGDNIIGYLMIFISSLIACFTFIISRKKNTID